VTGDAARVNDASSLERLRAEMVACFNDELRTLHGGWDEAIARVREDAERQVTAIREQLQRLERRISEGVPEAAAAAMETAVAPLRSTVVSAEQVGQWAEQAARIHALALELGKGDSTEGPLAQLASLTAALSGARDAVASGELRFTVSASLASLRPDELMAHVQAEALRCVREVADVLAQGDGVRRRLVETLVPAVVDLCEPPPQQVDDVIVRLPLEGPLLALVQAAGLEDVCPARLSPYDAKTQTVVTVVPSADAACKNRLAGCFKRGFRHGGRMVRRAAVTRFIVGDAR